MHNVEYNYCPQCGQPLIPSYTFGRLRLTCPHCNFIYWGEFCLGVGGVVWRDDKVLLVQRAHNPGKGTWTIPGGYVDQDERLEDAVVREIYEETGVKSEPVSVLALRDRPGDRHDLYVAFLMRDLGNSPQGDQDEVKSLGFFTWEDCQSLPLADLSKSIIDTSRRTQNGLRRTDGIPLIGDLSVLYKLK